MILKRQMRKDPVLVARICKAEEKIPKTTRMLPKNLSIRNKFVCTRGLYQIFSLSFYIKGVTYKLIRKWNFKTHMKNSSFLNCIFGFIKKLLNLILLQCANEIKDKT